MHEVALKVPSARPVYKQIRPFSRLVAVGLAFLFIASISDRRANAALAGAWTPVDVGSPAIRGTAQETSCPGATDCPVFTIGAAGLGIGGTSDQFMFVHQRLTGDGVIKLRLISMAGTPTMEAGLMLRESLTASARHASILAGAASFTFRSRTAAGGATSSLSVARGGWLRLERAGPAITASVSSDGTEWTVVATESLTLPATVYVGIVVTSRAATTLATASVSSMSVTPTTPSMPAGWASADVGAAASPGTASYSSGSFVGSSYGAGFAGTGDAFRFIYTRVRGDARLTTRVVAAQGRAGRQAGIVLRTTLDAGAAETALVADDAGVLLVRRAAPGQAASKTRVASAGAPVYLRLERVGSMVTVAHSTDGASWRTATSVPVSFGSEIYAGLAVAAGPNGGSSAAAFDSLSLVSVAANAAPVVSLTAPLTGKIVIEGQTVAMSATASDPDDLVARVDFRVNGLKIASDSAAPYTASWTAGSPGVYTVTAVAEDSDGAVTVSLPALMTVLPKILDPGSGDSGSGSWRLLFEPSLDHAKIQYYVLEIYLKSTRVLVASRNIGKPPVAADGSCTVDIDALVGPLPRGLYDGVVRAVETSTLTAASLAYTFDK